MSQLEIVSTASLESSDVDLPARIAYDIDPTHALAQFSVKHLMVSNVRGELGQVTGRVWLDPERIWRSEVMAQIDATGVQTRNESRDAHLRSADFFDVENHPTIIFRSTRVIPTDDGSLRIDGLLTIRGVSRVVSLRGNVTEEVRDPGAT